MMLNNVASRAPARTGPSVRLTRRPEIALSPVLRE
jgi:hypothetical protein